MKTSALLDDLHLEHAGFIVEARQYVDGLARREFQRIFGEVYQYLLQTRFIPLKKLRKCFKLRARFLDHKPLEGVRAQRCLCDTEGELAVLHFRARHENF